MLESAWKEFISNPITGIMNIFIIMYQLAVAVYIVLKKIYDIYISMSDIKIEEKNTNQHIEELTPSDCAKIAKNNKINTFRKMINDKKNKRNKKHRNNYSNATAGIIKASNNGENNVFLPFKIYGPVKEKLINSGFDVKKKYKYGCRGRKFMGFVISWINEFDSLLSEV